MLIERLAIDTPKSFASLCDYFALGDGRSLPKLAERYRMSTESVPTKHVQTLKRWSMEGNWQLRIQAASAAQRADDEQRMAGVRQARRLELEQRDWDMGANLRTQCAALLEALPRFVRSETTETEHDGQRVKIVTVKLNASVSELARALTLASQLQRLALGQPTEHISSDTSISVHYIDTPEGASALLDEKLLRYSSQAAGELASFLDRCKETFAPEDYAQLLALAARG